MPETILVTGGNIGNFVVDGLVKKGRKVRVTAFGRSRNSDWASAGIEQVEFDYARPDSLEKAFAGVDAYFSVSPLIENLAGTGIQAVEAAKKAGVKRIVRSSVLGAADDGITFARWHRAVEKTVEESGIPYTILRPMAFMQNFLFYAEPIKKDNRFYAAEADAKASFVDTRDIAEVAVTALVEDGHAGKTYKITGGEAISNADAARAISEATGRKIEYVPVSEAAARDVMLGMGMPARIVEGMNELGRIMVRGWLAGVETDFERVTGRAPRTFLQFARDYRASFC